jgi:uncharacterized membrane protein
MRVRILSLWEEIRSSYWFVPALMAALAVGLSFVTIAIDDAVDSEFVITFGLIWSGGAEGARGLLSTVAGSMITVAGVTFSITIAAFAQASSQFGPRLLRSFMRDTGNQIVLGTYIATFAYCLLILRTIRAYSNGDEVVPYISVSLGVLFGLASLGVLIYFIHHASRSIQAPVVIASVAADLFEAIERLFPAKAGSVASGDGPPNPEEDVPQGLDTEGARIVSAHNGYMLAVDNEQLLHLTSHHDLVVRLMFRPGQFVPRSDLVIAVWPPDRVSRGLAEQIEGTFVLGHQRTPTQDVEFAIDQLVEVAVRSLSPSINDPFTAVGCINWLGAALSRLAEVDMPTPYHYDGEGNLRLIASAALTYPELLDTTFSQIRQYAGSSAAVYRRLLEVIAAILPHTHTAADRSALVQHATLIRRGSMASLSEQADRANVEASYDEVIRRQASIDGGDS